MTQIESVKEYIKMVESLRFDAGSTFIHPDYSQWELPNLLNRAGQKSDGTDSSQRMETARKILSSQSYQITSLLEQGNTVVLEALWKGKMAVEAGPFKKGQELKAFFCMIFEFKDSKIHRIRNYDCFEDFTASKD